MKLLRIGSPGSEVPAILDSDGAPRSLEGVVDDLAGDVLADMSWAQGIDPMELPALSGDLRIGPCVAGTGKFICIGLNYSDHAAETGQTPPDEPILFGKATSSIIGPNDDVMIPKDGTKVDWEVELGIVIGKEARYVSREQAPDHVAGFCVVNDISERAFQLERTGQWIKGKSADTFGPIGPWLVTPESVGDVANLSMWLEVDGQRFQDSSTRNMIFDVPELVSQVSKFMSLQPGDLITTGTPPGVGLGMTPQVYLKPGQVMTLEIEGLGRQRQTVVAYSA